MTALSFRKLTHYLVSMAPRKRTDPTKIDMFRLFLGLWLAIATAQFPILRPMFGLPPVTTAEEAKVHQEVADLKEKVALIDSRLRYLIEGLNLSEAASHRK